MVKAAAQELNSLDADEASLSLSHCVSVGVCECVILCVFVCVLNKSQSVTFPNKYRIKNERATASLPLTHEAA